MGRLIHKQVAGIHIAGFSLAGEESVIAAPEFNVCFDVGRAPREVIAIDNICLTHGHMDHAAGIAYYFSQRAFVGNAPGRVIVHRELAGSIQRLMGLWADIEGHPSPGQVIGVEPLEDVPLRRNLLIRPFEVDHGANALGFTLVEIRHKLKPEFSDRSGPQLVALKREGVEIQTRVEVPLLTCSGDTASGLFLEHDFVRNSKAVLLECTFFEAEHIRRARAGRHIHVNDLPRVLAAFPEAEVLLTHVTRRTDLRRAKRLLERVLSPDDLARTAFLMDRPAREGRPGGPGDLDRSARVQRSQPPTPAPGRGRSHGKGSGSDTGVSNTIPDGPVLAHTRRPSR